MLHICRCWRSPAQIWPILVDFEQTSVNFGQAWLKRRPRWPNVTDLGQRHSKSACGRSGTILAKLGPRFDGCQWMFKPSPCRGANTQIRLCGKSSTCLQQELWASNTCSTAGSPDELGGTKRRPGAESRCPTAPGLPWWPALEQAPDEAGLLPPPARSRPPPRPRTPSSRRHPPPSLALAHLPFSGRHPIAMCRHFFVCGILEW